MNTANKMPMNANKMPMDTAKEQLVDIAHQIYHQGLTPGKSGNISLKISINDDYRIFITPSGVSLKDITLENVIVVDMKGNQLEGQGIPSSELPMHLEIHKMKKDAAGVVHTHSPYATGFSFSNEKIPRLEGFGKIKNPFIKKVDYAPPGSMELAEIAIQGLLDEDVLILKNHGVLAIGANLDEAALMAEFIESIAKTDFIARVLNQGSIANRF